MTALVAQNFDSFVFAQNDEIKTTSLLVAEKFQKRHDDVLKKLRNLECSADFNARNFAAVEYTDAKGEKRPAYEMTKDGFMFLVMGFTGKAAAEIKEIYINAFNFMLAKLKPVPYALIDLAPINTTQRGILSAIVSEIATSSGKEGTTKVALWSRFSTHFKLNGFKELPAIKFDEAKSYLENLRGEYNRGFTLAVVKKDDLQTLGYDNETKMFAVRALEQPKPQTEWNGFGYASMTLGINDKSRLVINPLGDITTITRLREDDFCGTFETIVRELKLRGFHVVKDSPENKLETIARIAGFVA